MSNTATETKKPIGRPKGAKTKTTAKMNGHMIGSTPLEERQVRAKAEYVAKAMTDHMGFDVTPAQACLHGLHLAEQLHDHD